MVLACAALSFPPLNNSDLTMQGSPHDAPVLITEEANDQSWEYFTGLEPCAYLRVVGVFGITGLIFHEMLIFSLANYQNQVVT